MDRKGLMWKSLAGILIAAVILVVLSMFAINWINAVGSGKYDPQSCRASVSLLANTKLPVYGSSPLNLQCSVKKEITDTLVKRQILEDLASDLFDCWWQFGAGEEDFVTDIDPFYSDLRCYHCSTRRFSEDGFNGVVSIDEFEDYLDTKKIPTGEFTFSEFFTKTKNAKIDFGSDDIIIGPEDNFYVFFMASKGSEVWRDWTTEGYVAGGAAGAFGLKKGLTFIGTKLGSRAIPVAGWGLLAYDVYEFGLSKTDFFPGLFFTSGTEKTKEFIGRCDDFT